MIFQATKYPGVFTYESEKRKDKCYYIKYFVNGKQFKEKIGWGKEGFNATIASEIRSKRTAGARQGEEYVKITLGEGISKYREKKDNKDIKWELDNALDYFGYSVLLSAIKPSHIIAYLNHLKTLKSKHDRPFAAQTIMHHFAVLRQMYNYLIDIGSFTGRSPMTNEARKAVPTINNQIINYLSDEETAAVMDVLDSYYKSDNLEKRMLRHFFLFAILTGCRRSEIFKLTPSDVDFKRRIITLRDPKPGKDQNVEISTRALGIVNEQLDLIKQHKISTKYIFCLPNGEQRKEVSTQFRTLKKSAGITRYFRFHDLRHNFATAVLDAGADLYVVQKLLTHKDPKTTQKYAHIKTGRLGAAADAASDYMMKEKKKDEKKKIDKENEEAGPGRHEGYL